MVVAARITALRSRWRGGNSHRSVAPCSSASTLLRTKAKVSWILLLSCSELTQTVNEIIDYARTNSRKVICFLTGVPGAGKTLVGINIASSRDASGANRVFLSGNYPLVNVLQEALIQNRKKSIDLIQERLKAKESLTDNQFCILKSILIERIKQKNSKKKMIKIGIFCTKLRLKILFLRQEKF